MALGFWLKHREAVTGTTKLSRDPVFGSSAPWVVSVKNSAMKERFHVWAQDLDGEVRFRFGGVFYTVLFYPLGETRGPVLPM